MSRLDSVSGCVAKMIFSLAEAGASFLACEDWRNHSIVLAVSLTRLVVPMMARSTISGPGSS